ncbi:MAG: Fur family transcriptional regulator [Bacteroidales bacterium]
MADKTAIKILMDHGLKVTPQRTLLLQTIMSFDDHPSTDVIFDYIRFNFPNISLATVYNTLKLFSQKGIIKKFLTAENTTRYDTIKKKHHHIYYSDSDKLEDFEDKELDKLLKDYFKKKKIKGLKIEEISIQISGKSLSDLNPDSSNNKIPGPDSEI